MTVLDPIIVSQDIDPPRAEFELIVPKDLFYLQGHFPANPVLPGVTQVHWAISLARTHLPLKETFLGIEALKFHLLVMPDTHLKLTLEHIKSSGKLRFRYTSDAGLHSHGRILFG